MQKVFQDYVKRILGNIGKIDPVKSQAATPRRIERLIRGASSRSLRRRPAPGKWSVGEILAHLAEAELVSGYRMRTILSSSGTRIQAFDQDDWARNGRYNRQDPARSMELFRALREANLRMLRSLSPKEWKRYGVHAERGNESIRKITTLIAGHDLNHLRQIEGILARNSKGGKRK
jgi:hypothetical protein